MTKILMITVPQWFIQETEIKVKPFKGKIVNRQSAKRRLQLLFDQYDTKKYTVGRETGHKGFKHFQVRWELSSTEKDEELFKQIKEILPAAHIEKSEQWVPYETKEGNHWSSFDTVEVLKVRHGHPNKLQRSVLERLQTQSDREVDVWYDPHGKAGKSWLAAHLWEKGKAHYIPPYLNSVASMIQTAASLQEKDRREILVIDIPRSWKWTPELYTAMEALKDGLIMDPRYTARPINIRGTKILIFTNTKPKLDALSYDRWRIVGDSLS